MTIITRFAPSPTQVFCILEELEQLYIIIFMQKEIMDFFKLRIEDTDKQRSKRAIYHRYYK